MMEIVHDEKSPILQVPGSVTYGCVMGGMAMLARAGAVLGWPAWLDRRAAVPHERDEPHVPQAHWSAKEH